jgi:antitoxin component YwqK of YwqJK toxin-antitoxin module
MTRDQHLEFCGRCTNRKFDSDRGIICGITNDIADFESSCDNYKIDTAITSPKPSLDTVADHQLVASLPENVKILLRKQQDPVLAVIGGTGAAILGALIWALVTVMTKYQIGYMAIAVGLLVGFSVRYFGAGVDRYFGVIGAILALAGCALGNLLAQLGFAADAESIGYVEILSFLNFDLIVAIFVESFSPMDVLFYGFAAYEGYKFAFRKITEDVYDAALKGQLPPLPFAQFRIPLAAVLYILFAVVGFSLRSASEGEKIFYYPSGEKQSAGFIADGKQSGPWQYWWEDGKPMSKGSFLDGKQDSVWEYYSETGVLYRRCNFKGGVEHGTWSELYSDGKVSSEGEFLKGRKEGEWSFYYEDGALYQKGKYKLDLMHGPWQFFYPDGKPSATSTYEDNEPRGLWTSWSEEGNKVYEFDYGTEGNLTIVNSWNNQGKPEVKDGNGTYNVYFPDGKIAETGRVKDKAKSGIWKTFYADGSKREVGHFTDDVYYVDNMWSPNGDVLIDKGEGTFESYGLENALAETGSVSLGLREGEWTTYYLQSDKIMSTSQYSNGELNGLQKFFFEDGALQFEGSMENGKREGEWKWYFQNAMLESSVDFKAGKKEGVQHFYLDDGTLTRTEVYKGGELVESTIDSGI